VANSKSARKRIRQNETRRQRNVNIRSRMRTSIRQLEASIGAGDVEAAEGQLRRVESLLDRAVAKGVIPQSRASRKTSRLAQRFQALRKA
jgi:small subunit ribosomal protein S20